MLFNSIEFLIFLLLFFLLFWIFGRNQDHQNLIIVVASFVFYGWWDWRFLVLIVITSISSYYSGLLIDSFRHRRGYMKMISMANIILNLSILGYFKYSNFFIDNLNRIVEGLGYNLGWTTTHIILPVGISFYTFQALSYTIDTYRGSIKPTRDMIAFLAYISFFPQLVAGPIERATNLLPQFYIKRSFNYPMAVDGARQMLWGFFKKIVIADNCAEVVNLYWDVYEELSGLMLIQLAILFSFQIYSDFSGYSDIAIGCSKLFGIKLMRNFDSPYFSLNLADFWRRWHMSLMAWFRDYVYIPLGGSRCSKWKVCCNILIVFFLSGLWHGANWTFVAWGGGITLLF